VTAQAGNRVIGQRGEIAANQVFNRQVFLINGLFNDPWHVVEVALARLDSGI